MKGSITITQTKDGLKLDLSDEIKAADNYSQLINKLWKSFRAIREHSYAARVGRFMALHLIENPNIRYMGYGGNYACWGGDVFMFEVEGVNRDYTFTPYETYCMIEQLLGKGDYLVMHNNRSVVYLDPIGE